MAADRLGSFRLHRRLHEGRTCRYHVATHIDEGATPGPFVVARFHESVVWDASVRDELALALARRTGAVHPRVSRVVEHAVDDAPYFAAPYLFGVSLARFAERMAEARERIDLALAARITAETARTLDDVGALLGFDALDVDTQNVRLGWDGVVSLTLPVALTQHLAMNDSTPSVAALRHPSPEAVTGERVTARSLVFQAGVILYRLVEGRHPYQGSTPMETFMRIVDDRPDPLTNDDAALDAIIHRALSRDPERRFDRPRALAEAIEAQLGPCPTEVLAAVVGARCAPERRDDLDLEDDFGASATLTDPDPSEQTLEDSDT